MLGVAESGKGISLAAAGALDFALEALGAVPLVGGLAPLGCCSALGGGLGAIAGCFGALAGAPVGMIRDDGVSAAFDRFVALVRSVSAASRAAWFNRSSLNMSANVFPSFLGSWMPSS